MSNHTYDQKTSYWPIAMIALCISSGAIAQAAGDDAGSAAGQGLQEVVVTAQKRSESINRVPMTISAASAEALRDMGVSDPQDLGKLVPGFTYAQSGLNTPVYSIRGVGYYESSLGATPAVSVYVDQVPLSYPQMTRNGAFDLERVEVLKGPQGTLFGQNSTGGAINYIAAKPTRVLETGTNLTVGRFRQVDADGYISGPIGDTISLRLALGHQDAGDWQQSYTGPARTRGQTDISRARLLLDWTPADFLKLELSVSGWIDRSDTQAAQLVAHTSSLPSLPAFESYPFAPSNARAADWNANEATAKDDKFYQFALRADYAPAEHVTVTSLSSFAKLVTDEPVDADGTSLTLDNYRTNGSIRSINQELRLSADFAGTRLLIGGNYSDDVIPQYQVNEVAQSSNGINNSVPGEPINPIVFRSIQSIQTWAGFFNIQQNLTDRLNLQGGARYTADRRHFNGCFADAGDGALADSFNFLYNVIARPAIGEPGNVYFPPGGCVTVDNRFNPVVPDETLSQNNVSWRIGPDFKVAADVLLYANVSRGYKAGTFPSLGGVQASQFTPTRQESVLAYEAGFKATALDRRLQLNGAGFLYDYRDKQILGAVLDPFFGPLQQLVNVPKSRIYGAELQVSAVPIDGLQFDSGVTYVASQVTSHFQNFSPYGTPIDFYHSAFPFTPKWQGLANLQYTRAVTDAWAAFIGAGFTYNSRTFGAFGAEVPYNPSEHAGLGGRIPNEPVSVGGLNIPAYGVLDLRAGIETKDHKWRVSAWGRNVTSKYYWTNATFLPADATVRFAGKPATFGLTFAYRY